MKLATDGMMELAPSLPALAVVPTSVTSVEKLVTKEKTARTEIKPRDLKQMSMAKRPKYFRHFAWSDSCEENSFSPNARHTLTDPPLPCPHPSELSNSDAMTTIRNNPHLFPIVTPIKVDRLEQLLSSHPCPTFTRSVCDSFREGFWPWADTHHDNNYPVTWDHSFRPPKNETEAIFIRNQRDIEISAGRFSPSFHKDLLPGMYSLPIHSVPKPHTTKLRLVTDHSAGKFSLNSMIAREDVQGSRLDTIADLSNALIRFHRIHGHAIKLIMFKSDVQSAYRNLPCHPLWQIKQINTIDGCRHVDHCTCFGNSGAPRNFTSFMGCVLWICIFVKFIVDLFGYIDDNFSLLKLKEESRGTNLTSAISQPNRRRS